MGKTKNKKPLMKYYAIKEGKNVKNKIVRTWDECKKVVHGYPAVYKSFKTEEEALKYLEIVDTEKVKEQTQKGMERKKKIKATTRVISTRIDKQLYDDFIYKCEQMNMDKNMVIKSMILEWVL